MKKFTIFLTISVCLLLLLQQNTFAGFKNGVYYYEPPQTTSRQNSNFAQIQFFFNSGVYQPSLKQLNDRIKSFHQTMITTGYTGERDENYDYKIIIGSYPENGYSGDYEHLQSNNFWGGGFSYFFSPKFKISLSVVNFKAEASSQFSSTFFVERYYPEVSEWINATWAIQNSINIRPLLVSALYEQPLMTGDMSFSIYGGGGFGFYFTTVKNKIEGHYGDEQLHTTTYNYELVNNFQANTNPLGFHALAGFNFGYKTCSLNFDISYHYAEGALNQWNNSTRMKYYVYGMSKELMETLNVDAIDLGGLMFRGGINLSF